MILIVYARHKDLRSRLVLARQLFSVAVDICRGKLTMLSYDYSCMARNGREVVEGARSIGIFDTEEIDQFQRRRGAL